MVLDSEKNFNEALAWLKFFARQHLGVILHRGDAS